MQLYVQQERAVSVGSHPVKEDDSTGISNDLLLLNDR